jgi:pilus assembly protein CpaF
MDGENIQVQEILRFEKDHTDSAGIIHGDFRATGIRPHFLESLQAYGISVPDTHFASAA